MKQYSSFLNTYPLTTPAVVILRFKCCFILPLSKHWNGKYIRCVLRVDVGARYFRVFLCVMSSMNTRVITHAANEKENSSGGDAEEVLINNSRSVTSSADS